MSAINALSRVIGLNYVTGSPWPKEKSLSRGTVLAEFCLLLICDSQVAGEVSFSKAWGRGLADMDKRSQGWLLRRGLHVSGHTMPTLAPDGLVRTSNVSVMRGTCDRCPPVIVIHGG